MPISATAHGARHVGFALHIAVLAVTTGYVRGAEVINYGSYNNLNSISMISVPLYGLDQGSSDVTSHELQLAMLSKDGMTADHFSFTAGSILGSGYFRIFLILTSLLHQRGMNHY